MPSTHATQVRCVSSEERKERKERKEREPEPHSSPIVDTYRVDLPRTTVGGCYAIPLPDETEDLAPDRVSRLSFNGNSPSQAPRTGIVETVGVAYKRMKRGMRALPPEELDRRYTVHHMSTRDYLNSRQQEHRPVLAWYCPQCGARYSASAHSRSQASAPPDECTRCRAVHDKHVPLRLENVRDRFA